MAPDLGNFLVPNAAIRVPPPQRPERIASCNEAE
jgi:hypothetical protein